MLLNYLKFVMVIFRLISGVLRNLLNHNFNISKKLISNILFLTPNNCKFVLWCKNPRFKLGKEEEVFVKVVDNCNILVNWGLAFLDL